MTPEIPEPTAKVSWGTEPPRTAYAVVQWIRDTCETRREKGDRFERASRYFLMNDPLWKAEFRNVWMWKDAPTNDGKDLGIDLVAERTTCKQLGPSLSTIAENAGKHILHELRKHQHQIATPPS